MTNTTNPWDMLWAIQAEYKCFWRNKWNHVSEKWEDVPFTKDDIDDMDLCEQVSYLMTTWNDACLMEITGNPKPRPT